MRASLPELPFLPDPAHACAEVTKRLNGFHSHASQGVFVIHAKPPHPLLTPVRRTQFLLFAGSRAKAPYVFSRASSAGKNKRPHGSTLTFMAQFHDQETVSAASMRL